MSVGAAIGGAVGAAGGPVGSLVGAAVGGAAEVLVNKATGKKGKATQQPAQARDWRPVSQEAVQERRAWGWGLALGVLAMGAGAAAAGRL